ncbi:Pentatricopeptide repeat-containing protein [Platanthera guangdongensis]|uniref:Pentatricopeptide repeat-containing protein n=1 Tax=Platanthera guangdongensis TaxID=2320717 RepID=A0ABR2MY04_9ASPA
MAARAPLLTLPPPRNSQNSGNLNKHKSECEFANYTREILIFSCNPISSSSSSRRLYFFRPCHCHGLLQLPYTRPPNSRPDHKERIFQLPTVLRNKITVHLCAEELLPNLLFFVFPVVLKACGGINSIDSGKELHGFLHKRGFISNIYVSNALIDMYGKCRAFDEALKVFDGMEERDCVSWNSIITG